MQRRFDLNGVRLLVVAEDDGLVAPLLPYLEELSAHDSPVPDFVLNIFRNDGQGAPCDAQLVFEGPLPEGQNCRLMQRGDVRWLHVGGDLTLETSVNGRHARLSVRQGAEWLLGGTAAIVAIEAALQATGQFLVHAAALRFPKREAGFVVFARSGAGKTTTALALTLSGFGLLADDATVLVPPSPPLGNEFKIWGLPRGLKVHYRTRDLLPRIAPLMRASWNADGEQVLSRHALKTIVEVCSPGLLPLSAIVMLQSRVEGPHVLRRAEKTDIMANLAADNVRQGPAGLQSDQLSRFQTLAAVVAATPTFELRVGSDISSLGSLVSSIIDAG